MLFLFPTLPGSPPAPPATVSIAAATVLVNGVDKTSFVSMPDEITIVSKQNERSTCELVFLPGYVPNRFDTITVFDNVVADVPKFGGTILQVGTESYEQGLGPHKTPCLCVDAMVYTDWSFWFREFTTTVTLKNVLQSLVSDKLSVYGITLDPAQDDGDAFDPFVVGSGGIGQKISDFLRQIATSCNPPRVVQMSSQRQLRLLIPGSTTAPFNVTNATPHCLDLNWKDSTFTPANKVTLVCGPTGTLQPTQQWTVQAGETSWVVDIQALVGGGFGGTAREVGIADRTVSPPGQGGYYYWDETAGKGTLSVGLGAAAPAGTVLQFVYTAVYPFVVTASTGAAPVVEAQASDPDQLLLGPAQAEVNGLLAQLNQSPRDVTIITLERGFEPNQAFSITLATRELAASNYTVTQVTQTAMEFASGGERLWLYTVEASETTVAQGSYLEQARRLFQSGGGASVLVSGSGGGGGGAGVSGSGIIGSLAKWTNSTALGSSIITESGSVVTVSGQLAVSGGVSAGTLTGPLDAGQLTGTLSSAMQDAITRLGTVVSGVWNAGAGTFAGNVLPALTSTYDLGSELLIWRRAFISQLEATLFVEATQTIYGGWLSVNKGAGTFPTIVLQDDTTIDFGQTMTQNQFVLVRARDTSGAVTEEFIKVGTNVSGTTYNVTRNLSGIGAKTWAKGTPYAVRGVAGDGWVELNAFDTPRMSIFAQGTNYNNSTELIRIGHLSGMPNTSGGIGIYAGDATNYFLWDGATFQLIAANARLDATGLTLASNGPSAFDASAALKFDRDSSFGIGMGNIFGLWTQSSGGTYQDLILENYADRGGLLGVGAAKASVYIKATGWASGTAPGSATTTASIRVRSEVGISTVTLDGSPVVLTQGQLGFPASQNASSDANTLDDYEEGTSTPTITGTTSASGQAYSAQTLEYTKIGDLVTFSLRVTLSTLGTITGNVLIGGLPFASSNTIHKAVTVGYWANTTQSFVYLTGIVTPGSTTITLEGATSAAIGLSPLVQADLSATSDFIVAGSYRV